MYTQDQQDRAARNINGEFMNDTIFGDRKMDAGSRLMWANVKKGNGSPAPSSRKGNPREDAAKKPTPAPPTAPLRATKGTQTTAKNVEVYPESATTKKMIEGPTDRIRGANVLRLAKKYGNQQLADLMNAAHPSEDEITGNAVNERMKSAYSALDDSNMTMRKAVEKARADKGIRVGSTGKGV
ncbi:hypothetical protein Slin15195_G113910 [Septoria linicola]|uniref:Uncharacterized protein n=1 Tax=Septoria linicola TaxID=215465 RepID=A0A9Q9AY16_9PEZI|nr:hypothetical protein Slin15195_G113910 [Septoria linicola]